MCWDARSPAKPSKLTTTSSVHVIFVCFSVVVVVFVVFFIHIYLFIFVYFIEITEYDFGNSILTNILSFNFVRVTLRSYFIGFISYFFFFECMWMLFLVVTVVVVVLFFCSKVILNFIKYIYFLTYKYIFLFCFHLIKYVQIYFVLFSIERNFNLSAMECEGSTKT